MRQTQQSDAPQKLDTLPNNAQKLLDAQKPNASQNFNALSTRTTPAAKPRSAAHAGIDRLKMQQAALSKHQRSAFGETW